MIRIKSAEVITEKDKIIHLLNHLINQYQDLSFMEIFINKVLTPFTKQNIPLSELATLKDEDIKMFIAKEGLKTIKF